MIVSKTLYQVTKLFFFAFRELRRVVYVPFLGESNAGISSETVKARVRVKQSINSSDLSGAVGTFICTG